MRPAGLLHCERLETGTSLWSNSGEDADSSIGRQLLNIVRLVCHARSTGENCNVKDFMATVGLQFF